MQNMTADEYQHMQEICNGVCDITGIYAEKKDLMRCVTCPFCKETVDAILTLKTIACPSCNVVVTRQAKI